MQQGGNVTTATVNGQLAYGVIISEFRCPSDPSPAGGTGMGNPAGPDATWAVTNYVCNYLVFGNPGANSQEGAARIPSSFPDGTSNAVILGERFGQYGSTPYSSLWANSGSPWRPQMCSRHRQRSDGLCGLPTLSIGCNLPECRRLLLRWTGPSQRDHECWPGRWKRARHQQFHLDHDMGSCVRPTRRESSG